MEKNSVPLPVVALGDNRISTVPSYQRQFAWREEQVKTLLEDIEALGQNGDVSSRFLGYLTVTQPTPESSIYYLIDGQQRITTLSLLCSAFCKRWRSLNPCSQVDTFEYEYLFSNFDQVETYRYLPQDYSDSGIGLDPRGNLQATYRQIISNNKGLQNISPQTPAAKRLWSIKNILSTWMEENVITQEHIQDMLDRLSRIDVVIHRVLNDAEGAEIFDGINNRGKQLSDIEKIKSYAFYLYNKSLTTESLPESLTERIETTNSVFEATYKVFDKYAISDDKTETQFVDSYYPCIADYATEYLNASGSVGTYESKSFGASSVKALLPVRVLKSSFTPLALHCLNQYLAGYPTAAEWFGDIARAQELGCYRSHSESPFHSEMVVISRCLKLLRRSVIAAPLVMAYRKVNANDDKGLISLLRYLERWMYQLSLSNRTNKGAAFICEVARRTVKEKLDAVRIIEIIHDNVAPRDADGVRLMIYSDEELRSAARGFSYHGNQMSPAVLYAHYHWLKLKKFKISYYELQKSVRYSEFHFAVKPTRFGQIREEHDDFKSKYLRDHPINIVTDKFVDFDAADIISLNGDGLLDRLKWLKAKYKQTEYFELDGCNSSTWAEKRAEEFAEWFVKRWSLNTPNKLPKVRITLNEYDFDQIDMSDGDEDVE